MSKVAIRAACRLQKSLNSHRSRLLLLVNQNVIYTFYIAFVLLCTLEIFGFATSSKKRFGLQLQLKTVCLQHEEVCDCNLGPLWFATWRVSLQKNGLYFVCNMACV
jgi:hypothetical protein